MKRTPGSQTRATFGGDIGASLRAWGSHPMLPLTFFRDRRIDAYAGLDRRYIDAGE